MGETKGDCRGSMRRGLRGEGMSGAWPGPSSSSRDVKASLICVEGNRIMHLGGGGGDGGGKGGGGGAVSPRPREGGRLVATSPEHARPLHCHQTRQHSRAGKLETPIFPTLEYVVNKHAILAAAEKKEAVPL